jgi:hypothetical protein
MKDFPRNQVIFLTVLKVESKYPIRMMRSYV